MDNFYNNKESVEQYIQMAEGHDGREIISRLESYLMPNKTILEIGSGPGSDFKNLSIKYRAVGSDYSDEFLKRLKIKFPKNRFLNLDVTNIKIDEKFDCIYSNKVLHHLSDEELKSSLDKQYDILNSDGIMCHSFWLGNGSENFKGMFVNLHLMEDIRELFSNKFQILELNTYTEFEKDDSLYIIAKRL